MRRSVLLLTVALGACTLEPSDTRPEPPVPPSWPVGDAYLRTSEAALPSVAYRDVFRDVRLQGLIERALSNNRDLRVAADNIAVARAQYRIQRAELFPEVSAVGTYRFTEGNAGTRLGTVTGNGGSGGVTNGTGNGGTGTGNTGAGNDGTGGTGVGAGDPSTGGGTDAGAGSGGTPVTGGTTTLTTTGLTSSSLFQANLGVTAFEVDLFGRVRSLSRAALNEYFATEAAARTTRLALVGDIATAWLTYAADRTLLDIARRTAASAGRSVRLTRARLEGGVAPRTDLRQAETVLATAEADLARQTTAVAQDANFLQRLVGAPFDPSLLPNDLREVTGTLAELPAGLDSTVLLRRPDIVEAEYRLRAANARIGAARAALFPRISLTGLVGLASTALGSLFTSDAFSASVSPNVSYAIFDGGARRAAVAQTEAQRQLALDDYERTIQTGFREVADALARRGTVVAEERAVRRQVDAATDTYRLAEARYRGGIDTFLQTLDSQRQLYASEQRLANIQLERANNLVTLYRSLGGDAALAATSDGPVPLGPEPSATPTPLVP